MVKPITCNFIYYHIEFNFININKLGDIGVFTDSMNVDKISEIQDKIRNLRKEFGNTVLYAFVKIYRVYEEKIKRYAFKKQYNFVCPNEKVPDDFLNYLINPPKSRPSLDIDTEDKIRKIFQKTT